MVQLQILKYFNSKYENKSLLVVDYITHCGVPDGLVKFGCFHCKVLMGDMLCEM